MLTLFVKNSQGNIFEVKLGSHPTNYMATVFLMSGHSDIPDEMTTMDLMTDTLPKLLISEGYTVLN